jgi:predicted O-methyltransferase YrrM
VAGAESIRAEDIARLSPEERVAAARAIASSIELLLPTRPLADILPGADRADVCMLPRLIRRHLWAMPEHELLTLGAITRMIKPARVVEFGTFEGGSTLVMAANMAEDGSLVTIDLDPSERGTHEHGLGTGMLDFDLGCLFRDTRYAPMIQQRYGNTLHVDDHDLVGGADLVFIDADHTYAFVKQDTAKALTCVRPGGWIVWHDYTWEPEHSECAGVTRAVNEFFQQHGRCVHIEGTRFAIHRTPSPAATTPDHTAQAEHGPGL